MGLMLFALLLLLHTKENVRWIISKSDKPFQKKEKNLNTVTVISLKLLKPGSRKWDKHKHKHKRQAYARAEMVWFVDDWFCACVCLAIVLVLVLTVQNKLEPRGVLGQEKTSVVVRVFFWHLSLFVGWIKEKIVLGWQKRKNNHRKKCGLSWFWSHCTRRLAAIGLEN